MTRHAELTMDDLLSDPLTISLMQADGVDPVALRRMLGAAGRRLEAERAVAVPSREKAPWREDAGLLRDCIHFARAMGHRPRPGADAGRPSPARIRSPW